VTKKQTKTTQCFANFRPPFCGGILISASIFKIKISHFYHQNFSKFLRLYTLFPWKFLEISLGGLQCFCSNTKDLINFKGTK
jgi:hypothetical protein